MLDSFIIVGPNDVGVSPFVDFWSHLYKDDLEDLYDANISIRPPTDRTIRALFAWKNGGPLSDKKSKSIEQNYIAQATHEYVRKATDLSPHCNPDNAAEFAREFLVNHFPNGGAIWRIFWLHCCNQRFPIYDQHVHRAMVFIEERRVDEIGKSDERKIELYLTRYLPFRHRLSGDERKIDRALHTFGRFIKAWPSLFRSH